MDIKKRFWEIDFLRGFAILMMIAYHLFFDLAYFGAFNLDSGFWWYFPRFTATIFIFLVGISLTLSFSRAKKMSVKNLRAKYINRGLKIFLLGVIITFVTWAFLKEGLILFGVLHFIGISIIFAYPFLRFRFLNLMFGAIFIFLGLYLKNFTFDFPWLLWIGFVPSQFYTLDYFPILPWFGVILIGLFFGNLLYSNYQRKIDIPEPNSTFKEFFCFLGRNSLLIYLVHQPIIIIILYFLFI